MQQADACTEPGEVGALLRREGLYSSLLTYWRKQRDEGSLERLSRKRGRKPADRRDREIAELQRRAERAEAELAKARKVIEMQGKVSALLEQMLGTEGAASPGAPGDDRADRQGADADHRHPAGVPRAGRVACHHLPSPATV